jgi:PAS domain S-box-containing protein
MDTRPNAGAATPPALAACAWDTTLAAVMVVDPETHTIVDVNRVGLALIGRSREEVVGRVCHDFVCPAQAGKCPITDLGQQVDHRERDLLTRGGGRTPILKSVREVRVEGRRLLVESFVDISALKETERALIESRQFIQTVVDGIGDPVLVIDPADYGIILANRAAHDRQGGDPAAPGTTCYRASHHVDRPCGEDHGPCPLKDVVATKGPVRVTHRHYGEAGEVIVDILATPVLAADGTVRAVIESNRDITLHKRAEEAVQRARDELQRQNEELRTLDRVKDALIGNISHELKTPVAKFAMQLEILAGLLRRLGVHEKVRDVLEVMESGIRRQQSVISNILMLSRLEAGGKEYRREPVRLDGVLEEVLADYLHLIASLGIRIDIDLEEAVVVADRDMLWHVFSNVVNNAVKYRAKAEPQISMRVRTEGGTVTVTIADNGIGLTPAEVAHAFERFYQASSSMEGIGVGLNISRIILEQFGGAIRIASAGKGLGASVIVTMPAAAPGGGGAGP